MVLGSQELCNPCVTGKLILLLMQATHFLKDRLDLKGQIMNPNDSGIIWGLFICSHYGFY